MFQRTGTLDCVIYFSLPVLPRAIYCRMAAEAENHRQLINSLEEASVLLDRSGVVLHSNAQFKALLGEDKPEQKAMLDLIPDLPRQWLETSLEADEVSAFIFDSSVTNSALLVSILPSEEYMIMMLWEKEQELPTMVQLQNLVPFGILLLDSRGEILKSNPSGGRLLGLLSTKNVNLNSIWVMSRDRANRRRPEERAPWNRALEQGRSVHMGPVSLGQCVLDIHCIPIQSKSRQVLVVLQDMYREHRNQNRLRNALEINRSINALLMDLLRVPGPEETIHRALRGALELIDADECFLITEEEAGSRIAFVEGSRKDLMGRENPVDPWQVDPALRKEGALLIRRMETIQSLVPDLAPHEYRGCLAASVLYEKNRRGLVLILRKHHRFKSRERRILQLLVPALSAAIFKFRYEARLNLLATTDPLTGLYNRRRFFAVLESAVRDEESPALLQMDLDLFKQINDSLGHQAGDRVLEVLAAELKRRETDGITAARTGGEEFMILLRKGQAENYRSVAEDLRQAVESLIIDWEPEPIRITLSIGGTRYTPGEKLADFYARADKLLYQAKESGRNRCCFESLSVSRS